MLQKCEVSGFQFRYKCGKIAEFVRQKGSLLNGIGAFCQRPIGVLTGRIVIMPAKIDPTILPACFRCKSSLRIGAEHLAVFDPRVFLSAGTKAVAFCRVAKQIVNCPKLVIQAQASRSVQSPKKGMWVATLVKIQMAMVSDIAAHLRRIGLAARGASLDS